MIKTHAQSIFKDSSTTYYYSSIFFRGKIKEDIFTLYAFVRTADNLVDIIPSRVEDFHEFKQDYYKASTDATYVITSLHKNVIENFIELKVRRNINDEWVESFLQSMEMDINETQYKTYEDLEKYIYGSAEVIGLMIAKILDLHESSYFYAKKLGEAMQFVNMIRDIKEDLSLKRIYMPKSIIETNILEEYSPKTGIIVEKAVKIYFKTQSKAEEGYKFIPYKYLVPIKTAADMYKYTANTILKNPDIVWQHKVKPSKYLVIFTVLKNSFLLLFR